MITQVDNQELKSIKEDAPKNNANKSTFFDQKVDQVVAAVQGLQKDKGEVSPEEIDKLFQKAQREIQNRRILEGQTYKVDATALLEDVEWELERTFRDKVFDALGDGFSKVRTAVAERNN